MAKLCLNSHDKLLIMTIYIYSILSQQEDFIQISLQGKQNTKNLFQTPHLCVCVCFFFFQKNYILLKNKQKRKPQRFLDKTFSTKLKTRMTCKTGNIKKKKTRKSKNYSKQTAYTKNKKYNEQSFSSCDDDGLSCVYVCVCVC